MISEYHIDSATSLLRKMVNISSFSGKEDSVADLICMNLKEKGIEYKRVENNILSFQKHHDNAKVTFMLNSHIDTVLPSSGYTFDPFDPPLSGDRVNGLGSNDAGASVVSMIEVFSKLYNSQLPFNLALILTAEEEKSGSKGMEMITPLLSEYNIQYAIIGEPTTMKVAEAERGLLVIDAIAHGVSGHAARNEGINAIYVAIEDITKLRNLKLPKVSKVMGEIGINVTQIDAGDQHNVIPDKCKYTVDIRTTEQYTNGELMDILSKELKSELKIRNLKNRSSATKPDSPLLKNAHKLNIETYVSPTTSDWMRIDIDAIKFGPGDSSRSHRADEYVTIDELKDGMDGYYKFITNLVL